MRRNAMKVVAAVRNAVMCLASTMATNVARIRVGDDDDGVDQRQAIRQVVLRADQDFGRTQTDRRPVGMERHEIGFPVEIVDPGGTNFNEASFGVIVEGSLDPPEQAHRIEHRPDIGFRKPRSDIRNWVHRDRFLRRLSR